MMMDSLPTPDTNWVNQILQALWNVIWTVIMTVYNMIPIVGSDPITVEAAFYICGFGGVVLFIMYYGDGIIIQIIEEGLSRVKEQL